MASNITISSLTVTPGFGQNFLQCVFTDPNVDGLPYRQLKTIEFWVHTANDRGDDDGDGIPANATLASVGLNNTYHVVTDGAARYYWSRAVDKEGSYGAWFPSSKTAGEEAPQTASIGVDGFLRLPSGLIFQWGGASTAEVTFPIEFPNAVFNVEITAAYNGDSTHCVVANSANISNTGFDGVTYLVSNSGAVAEGEGYGYNWLAIGY